MTELTGISLPDYLVIAAYFGMIVFSGYYFSKYIKIARDFFAAGNVMPWWLAGTSYFMASFSTLLFVIYNEIAYKYGLVAVTICWIGASSVLISGYFLSHRWRRARILTPVEFMERRYSRGIHQLFVWMGFPLRLLDNGLKIFSTAIVVTMAVNHSAITFNRFVVIIGVIMIIYTFLGGQLAVIITDFVQAIIIAFAVITLFILAFNRIDSFSNFAASVPEGFFLPMREPYSWTYLIFTSFLLALLTYGSSWAVVQKYNCVRSEQDARKMVYYIALLKFITPPIFFFPGIVARYIYPNIENTRAAYAIVCLKILPAGLMGFMLAALFSATMSTLGSEYNTLSGVLTRDFYKKRLRPQATDRQEVFFGRIATIVIGVVTMSFAIFLNYIPQLNLMDIMYRIFSAFGPPIMIPTVSGLLFRKFNARGVKWGVISGVAVGLILHSVNMVLVGKYAGLMAENARVDFWLRSGWTSAATVISCLTTIGGMWIGTAVSETLPEEKERVSEFFTDLERPFELDPAAKPSESPFGIIGLLLVMFGTVMVGVSVLMLAGYRDMQAFGLDFIVGALMMLLGAFLRRVAARYHRQEQA
ncbi:MAG: hypothetical protein J7M24_05425 [Candidatus Latescibacteria bacterium]|nr:hypothetical protein [Candidatus Latescibacterota bacterium]